MRIQHLLLTTSTTIPKGKARLFWVFGALDIWESLACSYSFSLSYKIHVSFFFKDSFFLAWHGIALNCRLLSILVLGFRKFLLFALLWLGVMVKMQGKTGLLCWCSAFEAGFLVPTIPMFLPPSNPPSSRIWRISCSRITYEIRERGLRTHGMKKELKPLGLYFTLYVYQTMYIDNPRCSSGVMQWCSTYVRIRSTASVESRGRV